MTCYNRRETTLRCLDSLYAQKLPDGLSLAIFLVDDGCTDGTGAAVKAAHPDIQVIPGTGDLFWCNGMRLAWDRAAKEDPDFYLWLNDDVQLREDAVHKLLATYAEDRGQRADVSVSSQSAVLGLQSSDDLTIIVGSTCDPETGAYTYGGQRKTGKHPAKFDQVPPQDVPVECDTFHGNIVLVPRAVYGKIGNMHPFGHAMGDTDYGLRARRAGCRVVVAPGFAGACGQNRPGELSHVGFRKSWKVLMRR